jgi:uncharacterized protein (DUF2141 family)
MKSVLILFSLIFLAPPQDGKYRLAVTVTGLKPIPGSYLYVSLHQRPEYFQYPDSALMKARIAVNKETETIIFNNVPHGRYAVALYHDENLNGKLDVNGFGIPQEGYGFSTKSPVPGRPKFEQAAFDVNRNDTIQVQINYKSSGNQKKDSSH